MGWEKVAIRTAAEVGRPQQKRAPHFLRYKMKTATSPCIMGNYRPVKSN